MSAELAELRSMSVLALRRASATSSILMTTRSFMRRARASVNSIEAGRPSCHRLPAEAAWSASLAASGSA